MARIAIPDGDSPEIVRALSLRPDFAQAVGGFEKAVWGSSLDWRLHELVRMQVAMINECTVCLGWRTPQAIEAGVTDELLAGVADLRDVPRLHREPSGSRWSTRSASAPTPPASATTSWTGSARSSRPTRSSS